MTLEGFIHYYSFGEDVAVLIDQPGWAGVSAGGQSREF